MKKMYDKSPITLAIFCIVVYVVGSSVADQMGKSVTLIFDLVLAAVLYLFVRKNDLMAHFGLVFPKKPAKSYLYYVPLVILTLVNVWFGFKAHFGALETLVYVASMLLVGFLEELIFRGLLFKAMSTDNLKSAIIVSSLTFGIGHIVNLINGSEADLLGNLCQVCYAVAIGFLYVTIFHRGGSLVPCILSHGVFNALSAFSNEQRIDPLQIPVSIAIILLSLGYAFALTKTLPKTE